MGRAHGFPVAIAALLLSQLACGSGTSLPTPLSDEEFSRLSTGFSEPAGAFTHSENLVSNEMQFPQMMQMFEMLGSTGGFYIGVGPEQNFTYIAGTRPAMAFIIDIRRENLSLHLMYKALFELSANRAEFLSRLFSRERPAGLGPATTVQELFKQYQAVSPSDELLTATTRLVREQLLDRHGFSLAADDLTWIEHALKTFYAQGPDINYGRGTSPVPSYSALMMARDRKGQSRSYLATEEGFAFVRNLQTRNRIVPLVGDFGGPDAIRRVGDYIRQQQGSVRMFYGSNVTVYLNRQQTGAFCDNLAALPYDSGTWFIGSNGMQRFTAKLKACAPGAP